ncbi:MAG: recombination mediator RecR [Saccharospirillum sp.]|nr:recombination mediator RecR [Saccharospirillum sp.]
MAFTPLTDRLIEALQVLPGVGTRSAQRMALQLLERDRDGAAMLQAALSDALSGVQQCRACRALSETELCSLCADDTRDHSLVCVVESPEEREAVELSGGYKGDYFILQGCLSPIDGIGPDELGIPALLHRLESGSVRELVLALGARVEAKATSHYLIEQIKNTPVQLTQLAQGVSSGDALKRLDSGTLAQAMADRKVMTFEQD